MIINSKTRAEALDWTALQQLNNCGRYISVTVFLGRQAGTGSFYDCTRNGVTSRPELTLYVPHPRGNFTLEELTRDENWRQRTCILEILKPPFADSPIRFQPRGETRWMMAGGNYVGCCDSRFSELYRQPCSVHDRCEEE